MKKQKSALWFSGTVVFVMCFVLIIATGYVLVHSFIVLKSSLDESNDQLKQLASQNAAIVDKAGQPRLEVQAVIASLEAKAKQGFDANTVTFLLTVFLLCITAAATYCVLKAREMIASLQSAEARVLRAAAAIGPMAEWSCRLSGLLTCCAKNEIAVRRMTNGPVSGMGHLMPSIRQHLCDIEAELRDAAGAHTGIPGRLRDLCRNQIDAAKRGLLEYIKNNTAAITARDHGQVMQVIDQCDACVRNLDDDTWVERYEDLLERLTGLADENHDAVAPTMLGRTIVL